MLTASKPLFLKSSFRKSRVGVFWRNYLNRLVQPKLSNIQNDSNQLIFRRILNICFCIHHFLLQRAKFSYRQLIQLGTNMMVLMVAVRMEGECQCNISMKIRTTVVPMSMTSPTSLRAAKAPHHIDRAASWAGKIPYRIYFVIATIWCYSTYFSDPEFLTLSTKWRAQTGIVSRVVYFF